MGTLADKLKIEVTNYKDIVLCYSCGSNNFGK